MKKFTSIILIILLSLSLTACSKAPTGQSVPPADTAPTETAVPSTEPKEEAGPSLTLIADNLAGKVINEFDLGITLDTTEHRLIVTESIAYHNNTGTELSEIYFNLIPNAFKEEGGGIDMESIIIRNAITSLEQVKETVYKISLSTTLQPDETLNIQMEYVVHIPNIKNRFGYQDSVYNLGNFIVTPAVYDEDGWAVEPYVDFGDAFYTDMANYNVTINTPDDYTVAATGTKTANGGFHAEKVRDFAFSASKTYDTLSDTYHNTAITVYYDHNMTKTANRTMETAKNVISLYSELLGEYPYETLSIVMNELTGGVSGMEYPTLVMIGHEVTLDNMNEMAMDAANDEDMQCILGHIDRTVVHEIAHQWFYGIVGNDQIKYPWLDEGMCRFAEYLYEKTYPSANADDPMENRLNYIMRVDDKGNNLVMDDVNLNWSLYDWEKEDPMGYSEIYDKGGSLFYQMMEQMGDENFSKALRAYVNEFAYGFVTPESFKQFWNEQYDFSALFDLYFK